MIVSELHDILGTTQPTVEVAFADLEVAEDGSVVKLKGHDDIRLDEVAERALSKHLGVSAKYLERCPGDLKAQNLNYWIDQNADKYAVLTMTRSGDLIDVRSPEKRVVPVPNIGRVLTSVADPSDEVVTLHRDEKRFHIDIKSEGTKRVIKGHGSDWRPEQDVYHGGVRVVVPADLSAEKPSVEPYIFRVDGGAGWSLLNKAAYIPLKGLTVSDILDEVEVRTKETFDEADVLLHEFSELDEIEVKGNLLQNIRTLGQEHGLSDRVIQTVMNRALSRTEDTTPTMLDLTLAFTTSATDLVAYGTTLKLQRLGGHIFEEARAGLASRCGTCSHLLNG